MSVVPQLQEVVQPNVLVVEGDDERRLLRVLIDRLGLRDVQIVDAKGKDNIPSVMRVLPKTPRFAQITRSVGIARDADECPERALQSLQTALRNAGLPVPCEPMVPVGDSPRVTVIILPGRNRPGELEDLCLEAVESDPAMRCVGNYYSCLRLSYKIVRHAQRMRRSLRFLSEVRGQEYALPRKLSKAKVQTFLASRQEVALSLGIAAEKGYWPLDAVCFEELKGFLRAFAD